MTRPSGPRLKLSLAALWLSMGAQAAMYKWTDENGQTVYSQTPPPSGEAVRIRKNAAPDPGQSARAREELRKELERSYDKTVEQEQARSKKADEQRERATRAKHCESALKNLAIIENLGRRRLRTPDGEYKILSEDDREVRIRETRAQIEKFCD
jgi:hypothetical protein